MAIDIANSYPFSRRITEFWSRCQNRIFIIIFVSIFVLIFVEGSSTRIVTRILTRIKISPIFVSIFVLIYVEGSSTRIATRIMTRIKISPIFVSIFVPMQPQRKRISSYRLDFIVALTIVGFDYNYSGKMRIFLWKRINRQGKCKSWNSGRAARWRAPAASS